MLGTLWTEPEDSCVITMASYESILTNSKSFTEEVADALSSRAEFLANSHPSVLIGRDKRLIESLIGVAKAVRACHSEQSPKYDSAEEVEMHFERAREVISEKFIELNLENPSDADNTLLHVDHCSVAKAACHSEQSSKDDSAEAVQADFETPHEVISEKLIEVDPENLSDTDNTILLLSSCSPNRVPSLAEEKSEETRANSDEIAEEVWTGSSEDGDYFDFRTIKTDETYVHMRLCYDNSKTLEEERMNAPMAKSNRYFTLEDEQKESTSPQENGTSASCSSLSNTILPRGKRKSWKKRENPLMVSGLPVPQNGTKLENGTYWKKSLPVPSRKSSFERFGERISSTFRKNIKNVESAFSRVKERCITILKC